MGRYSIKVGQVNGKSKSGQATVEFAIVLALLMLLLIGVADVARIFSEHLAAVHAAGVGSRWLILDPDNRSCSSNNDLSDLRNVVLADLDGAISATNVLSVTGTFASNPSTVRVEVTYRHDYLFGLLSGLPGTFSGGATMPGTYVAGVGSCPTPPVPVPTSTPITVPTSTPIPTSTSTGASPTNTTGPSPTATCIPHSFTGASGCRNAGGGNQSWQVFVHVNGYGSGDLVYVKLCNVNSGNCGSANQMTCTPGGDCNYSGASASTNETRVEFSIAHRPGSCALAPLTVDLSVCGSATNTPTPVSSTSTPTITATNTTVPFTPTNTSTPLPPSPTFTFTPTPVPPSATRTNTPATPTSTPTPCTTNLAVSIVNAVQRAQGQNPPSEIYLDVLVQDPCNGNAPVTNATVNALIGTTPILNITLAHSTVTSGHYWACTSQQPVNAYNVNITASIPGGRTGTASGVTTTRNGNLSCTAP